MGNREINNIAKDCKKEHVNSKLNIKRKLIALGIDNARAMFVVNYSMYEKLKTTIPRLILIGYAFTWQYIILLQNFLQEI